MEMRIGADWGMERTQDTPTRHRRKLPSVLSGRKHRQRRPGLLGQGRRRD